MVHKECDCELQTRVNKQVYEVNEANSFQTVQFVLCNIFNSNETNLNENLI